jgi:O-antigen ligase
MALKRLAKDVGLLVLSLGMLVDLIGILFVNDGSRLTALLNLTFFLPALVLTLSVPAYRVRLFNRELLFVGLFLLFTLLVVCLNSQSEHSLKAQLKTALYVLVYLSAVLILALENKLERLLCWAFFLASAVAAASLLYQGVVLHKALFFARFRLDSLGYEGYADFGNAIVSALYFGVFAVIGVHQVVSKPMAVWQRAVWALCVAALGLYLLSTGSRGVWAGVLAAFFFSVILHLQGRVRAGVLAAAVLVLATATFYVKVVLAQGGRGISLRDQIWSAWYERLGEFWLTGAGAGNDFDVCVAQTTCFNQAHNLFLQTGYEYGLFGMLLLVLLIAVAWVRGMDRSVREQPLGSLGGVLMLFAVITALVNYHTVLNRPGVYWLVFWLPLALVIHARYMATQRGEQRAG